MNTDPTATEVERFNPVNLDGDGRCSEGQMEPRSDGDWVRYEDYEKLKEELRQVRSGLDRLKGVQVGEDLGVGKTGDFELSG